MLCDEARTKRRTKTPTKILPATPRKTRCEKTAFLEDAFPNDSFLTNNLRRTKLTSPSQRFSSYSSIAANGLNTLCKTQRVLNHAPLRTQLFLHSNYPPTTKA
ncbi:hypothetical protein D6783_05530 [Candidatus Woesearchaeota archaeon]|nr:MAG: hypothetical protein D6783_05530 [Candidatus Woesearchaeota archaeon]